MDDIKEYHVTYLPLTGTIIQVKEGGLPDSLENALLSAATRDEVCDVLTTTVQAKPDKHYMEEGKVREKTTFPQLTIDNGRVTGIPLNTLVVWPDGEQTLETDGELTFEANTGGDYLFTFYSPQHFMHYRKIAYNVA
jgi:hypothetical protein